MLSRAVIEPFRYAFHVVGFLSLAVNGNFYMMPQYTLRFKEEYGLSESDIVVLVVLSQAGLGVLQYPHHLLSEWLIRSYQAKHVDIILTLVSGVLLVVSNLLLATCTSLYSFPFLSVVFFLNSVGTGLCFALVLNVANFNFFAQNAGSWVRRVAVAELSISLGLGGCLFSIFYEYVLRHLNLAATFYVITASQAITLLLRILFLRKDFSKRDYEMDPEQTNADKVAALEEESSSEPEYEQEGENEPKIEQQQVVVERERKPVLISAYARSSIVWLTSLCTAFGLAIGGVWLGSLGNLATYLHQPGNTFTLTLTFLIAQTLGRVFTALIYVGGDNPYVMTLWQIFNLLGFTVPFVWGVTFPVLYIATVLMGLSFGGIWGAAPVIAASNFPGGAHEFMRGLAILYMAITLIMIAAGFIQDVLIDIPHWYKILPNSQYTTLVLVCFLVALLVAIGSFVLAMKLRRIVA
mmetsp:Transcript_2730/g.5266  ORF Transcript_2730/g.5266 Transcript_2730/m.5266 type:complete len:465 (-) Transcript_2730:431-1825(-)